MELQTSSRLEGIGEYYFSRKLREIEELNRQGEAVNNLGIGSPDLPPHPTVTDTLAQWAQKPNTHAYQNYKGIPALREAIASWYQQWYNVALDPATEVLPLIGSKEGIVHISMTYLDKGDEALIPNPGYPTYRAATLLAGGTPIEYNLKEATGWEPDLGALEDMDLSRVKLMWVNYPHMPTGKLPTQELFQKLVAFARRHNILLCHDNPYSFILNDQPLSLLAVPGAKDVAIELNSLSKSHNMAGWRIGMLLGAAERINEVLRFKSNMDSGMFLPVQQAAAAALSLGQDWFSELNQIYAQRRSLVFQLLDTLACQYDRNQGGLFVWAGVPAGVASGFDLSDAVLRKARVFITPGGIFGSEGDPFIRVSLCSSESTLQQAMARINQMEKA